MVTLALAYDIDAIAAEAELLAGGLAEAAAAQQRALHLDHRVPGAQGQSEGHQGLGRPGASPASRSSRRIRRRRAARAGTTWRPGATRCDAAGRRRGEGARTSSTQLFKNVPGARLGRARLDDHLRRSAASATCCSPGRTRRCLAVKELGPGQVRDRRCRRSASWPSRRWRSWTRSWTSTGTRAVAEAYLEYLYTPEGQEIAAQALLPAARPERGREVRGAVPARSTLFTIDEVFGGWAEGADRRTSTTAACSTRSTSRR